MTKIVLLNEELKTQMQIYLALCDAYRVEIAEDPEAVMYMLRKLRPQILLLDFTLEHFQSNGKTTIDFLKKIKKKYRDLKVMMLLDDEEKEHEESVQAFGADSVLYKPVKNKHLLRNVRKLSAATTLTS
jgi:DNA-binding response OmpR family regulator